MQKIDKKKMWIGIWIGVIVSVLTLVAMFKLFLYVAVFGGPPKVIRDTEKYVEALELCSGQRTGFIVFPEQIPEGTEDEEFYFFYQDTWNTPTVEAFLQCTYSEEEYVAEVERLENTQKRYGSKVSTLMRDEEGNYPYPAYIAVDGLWSAYEYAMLTGEREITYIYMAYKKTHNLKRVEEEYLPKGFEENQTNIGPDHDGYSIYLIKTNYWENGDIESWECDYSRDAVPEILDYKYVKVGYNIFHVIVYLDENDREIIKECSYSYYSSRYDSQNGLPDKIFYSELAGYEYKSLELTEDGKQAIVTYYDNGEEKTYAYDIPEK